MNYINTNTAIGSVFWDIPLQESVSQIAEGMNNASSALSAAVNSFEELVWSFGEKLMKPTHSPEEIQQPSEESVITLLGDAVKGV